MIDMSPSYYSCPECGQGEFWVLADGSGLMCADWPDCGAFFASTGEVISRARALHNEDIGASGINAEISRSLP